MKTKLVLFALLLMFLLNSCAGAGDWVYDELPKDYVVVRINSRDIRICRQADEVLFNDVIDSYVSEIAYNDAYIFTKQVAVPEDLREKIDISDPSYFIVIVETDEVLGSFTEPQFLEQCEELGVGGVTNWTVTTQLQN